MKSPFSDDFKKSRFFLTLQSKIIAEVGYYKSDFRLSRIKCHGPVYCKSDRSLFSCRHGHPSSETTLQQITECPLLRGGLRLSNASSDWLPNWTMESVQQGRMTHQHYTDKHRIQVYTQGMKNKESCVLKRQGADPVGLH